MKLTVSAGGKEIAVEIDGRDAGRARKVVSGGEAFTVSTAMGGSEVIVEGARRRASFVLFPSRPGREGVVRLLLNGRVVEARVASERDRLRAETRPHARKGSLLTVASTLPGIIRRVLAGPGDRVDEATPLLTLEAMKMENEVRAEARGRVRSILVKEGQVVNSGDALAEIEVGEG